MEMIAMLNGLGRNPGPANGYLPPGTNPYFDLYRYKLNGFAAVMTGATEAQILAFIAAAKTEAEFADVLATIDASGLPPEKIVELKQKVEDARKPFYKKPLYWVGVAAVAWVGWRLYTRQPIIPSFSGLGAGADKRWVFDWVGGGYNTVFAPTKAAALRKAREMGKPVPGGMTVTLKPDAKSFRLYSERDPAVRAYRYMD